MKLAPALLVVLAGCSTIDRHDAPPPDFPRLRVVSFSGVPMPAECADSLLNFNLACTVPDYCTKTCAIYYRVRWSWVREHEGLHCRGYDHPKPDWQPMRASWLEWRDGPRRDLCWLQSGQANYCKKWPEDRQRCP